MIRIKSKLLNCIIAVIESGEVCEKGDIPYTWEEVFELDGKSKEEIKKYHETHKRFYKIISIFDGEVVDAPPKGVEDAVERMREQQRKDGLF